VEDLEKKGFARRWREWMEQVVTGGRVRLNLNEEPRNYFRTFKGLRKGDPFIPTAV
jgi:hypothetical protein